jgi:AcrR family transcriptional regulator
MMARKVREEDYTGKRNEILDAAQKLIYTRLRADDDPGILDEVRISKGAFYHYFDSKQALLQSMIDRMFDEGESLLRPIVENSNMKRAGEASMLLAKLDAGKPLKWIY